jgi:hypothetical protein
MTPPQDHTAALREQFENHVRSIWTDGDIPARWGDGYADQHVHEMWLTWCAALTSAQPQQPAGWKLVPENATKAMQDAWDTAPSSEDCDEEFHGAYRAMIDAAPAHPAEQQEGGDADGLPLAQQYEDACIAANANARDAARYRWLRDLACNSLHLTRDGDHACNYMTASDWIDNTIQDFSDDDPAEVERMRAANTIWRLQVYPNTPVGFNVWHGSTLDAAIDAAMTGG